MSLSLVYSRAAIGIDAPQVTVEVHLSNGLPSFSVVGLPETPVKESRDRVRSALINANFELPARRITVNLAPADLPKEGGWFDLPIAIGILAASGQIDSEHLSDFEFLGELALNGELREVKGVLPAGLKARQQGRRLILPWCNRNEAELIEGLQYAAVRHLLDVCRILSSGEELIEARGGIRAERRYDKDMADVVGQSHARRALEIAAAGGHNILFIGPPGTGKTMLASRVPGILPDMSEDEAMETAALYSVSGKSFQPKDWGKRYLRTPHHTASAVALVGGGSIPRPGEVSLAHNGILFLDELPEFDRRVLEVLREPLESGWITISRAARQVEFPARFQLIAAMNPCPCGYLGDGTERCHCTAEQISRYRNKISGPLIDRIDLHVEVPRVALSDLQSQKSEGESSAQIRERVVAARRRQYRRSSKPNCLLNNVEINEVVSLSLDDQQFLHMAVERLHLSSRAFFRILKLARTIADLAGEEDVQMAHLSEALAYRCLDRGMAV